MSGKRTAVVAGATGLVGRELLSRLLASPMYDAVHVLVRSTINIEHPKLTVHRIDFDRMRLGSIGQADDAFCCLGTTIKKAGTQDAFRKVDLEYPLRFAEEVQRLGAERYLVVSSMGANTRSSFFYSRVKGELEQRLTAMGFPKLRIFRPSLLLGDRDEVRFGERAGAVLMTALQFVMVGPLRKYRAVHAGQVAHAMIRAALGNDAEPVVVYESEAIANG